ncbi:MAG: histidinol-phosphatase [Kiloniellales bacterium]|nr:histidinol-phosphatase [Kiloniellales bacterium]
MSGAPTSTATSPAPAAVAQAPCPSSFFDLAESLADAARAEILPHFRGRLIVERKADESPVTAIDRAAESAMRRLIAEICPDHGIVGEEFEQENVDAEYVWVLDPIDGTKRFITGNPLFGTLIALLRDGVPLLGAIDMPVLGERWLGATGRPTIRRDGRGIREVRVRPCARLAEATVTATSPEMFEGRDLEGFHAVRQAAGLTLYGGDCFNYGSLAEGFVDLVIEAGMARHDYLALVPVVAGAGGIITDWRGGQLGLGSDGRVIAAGDRAVHEAATALIAGD